MRNQLALEVNSLSLKYFSESSRRTLKSLFINKLKRIDEPKFSSFELSDVTFSIGRGELVGIIGRNGSGKSTLLKLVSGVYVPSSGQIYRHGEIAPLVDLGTGMHPDLTCRQNVYLSNAYLGRSRRETRSIFEEIVEWSQIRELLDEPFHSLSTGTQTRLSFAIATSKVPDLLLVDEVMSVGDLQFQLRSKQRIREITKSGAALLIVSHDLDYLEKTVSRLLWIDKGRLVMDGSVQKVLEEYRSAYGIEAS
jgi:ABC-type polysaccharide/polyol phosphate transport system ATPase subunit